MNDPLYNPLHQGLAQLKLALPVAAEHKLLAYLTLLAKWNRAYNLSAVRDRSAMLTRHVLDSLAVMPYLHGGRVLDVGTGAGLPGLMLAIADPERHYVLLDGNVKKTRFVTQAVIELALPNVEVVHARLEHYRPEMLFDTVISRAFSELEPFFHQTAPLCRGYLLAMKGQALDLPPLADATVQQHVLHVPGLEAARHLVIIQPHRE